VRLLRRDGLVVSLRQSWFVKGHGGATRPQGAAGKLSRGPRGLDFYTNVDSSIAGQATEAYSEWVVGRQGAPLIAVKALAPTSAGYTLTVEQVQQNWSGNLAQGFRWAPFHLACHPDGASGVLAFTECTGTDVSLTSAPLVDWGSSFPGSYSTASTKDVILTPGSVDPVPVHMAVLGNNHLLPVLSAGLGGAPSCWNHLCGC
jgi:hypothetical protein